MKFKEWLLEGFGVVLPMASKSELEAVERIKNKDRDNYGILKTPARIERVALTDLVRTQNSLHNPGVEQYSKKINSGENISKGNDQGTISGDRIEGKVYVDDGHHRLAALAKAGVTYIDMEVRDYSRKF
jgi:hypothetical protein